MSDRPVFYDHWKQVPRSYSAWPYKYFIPSEAACKYNGSILIVPEFIRLVDTLRSRYGNSLTANSWYRSPIGNALVGGAPLSRHKKADAVDMSIVDRDRQALLRIAQELGFTGFGFYNSFLHLDLGRSRSWGSWQH